MAEHATPATCGVDHVGLSVRDLESARRFFCDCLGWRVVGERPDYPAAFVSDSHQIVILWRVEAPDRAVAASRTTCGRLLRNGCANVSMALVFEQSLRLATG